MTKENVSIYAEEERNYNGLGCGKVGRTMKR
jgi:hypothetical protein